MPGNGQQKKDDGERVYTTGIPPRSRGWKWNDILGHKEDNIDDESVIALTKLWDMAQSLCHFTMTKKDILDCVLDSNEIFHELAEKSLLQQAAEKKIRPFKNKFGESVSFYM